MELTNCYSEEEKKLKETNLEELSNDDLLALAYKIKYQFELGMLEDEEIAIDALVQIVGEMYIRR